MVKTLSNAARKTLDKLATDSIGSTCAACEKPYRIWYVATIEIGRQRCACEPVSEKTDRFGLTASERERNKRYAKETP